VSVAPTTTDTSAALPAPVIPYGNPTTGSIDQTLTAENQAQQITSASLSAYGSLPNPQLAFEAITTGSTPTIASMIQAGNPLFQAELAGAPAGGAASASPYPQVPSKINDPSQSLWTYDPKQHAQDLKNPNSSSYLGGAQAASWKTFGDAPEMNFGWMQSVQSGPPAQTRKWQQLLKDKGFYQGQGNYQVSGVWDTSTKSAFQSFMIQWATPYALFSTDATTKGNANMFLNGLGFDSATLSSSIGRDPSTLAQVAQGWMAAQGPVANDQKSELQQYSDTFGLAALPDSYQAILHGDFLTGARNTLAGALGILNPVPVLGGALHVAENVLTGNVGDQLAGKAGIGGLTADPRQAQADKIKAEMTQQDKLSGADVANLTPALQSVADDAGFLGFMNSYDNARTNTLLTVWDTFGEVFTKGKMENPFDPLSTPRIEAAAADNNLAAGIFGQGWVNQNPGWAGLFNVAINIVDDPTSYISLIGKIPEVARFNGVRTASRVIGNDKARAAFADKTAEGMKVGVNQGLFNAARTAYKDKTGVYGLTDIASMYGVNGSGGARDVASMQLLQKAMEHPDPHAAWDLMQNGDEQTLGFGWKVQSGKGVFNARANWKALSQVKSQTMLGRMRAVGGFNTSTQWNALADPAGTSGFLRNMSIIAEMDPKEITPALDAYWEAALKNPDKAVPMATAAADLIMKKYASIPGVDLQKFNAWRGEAADHIVTYAPDPTTGAETSFTLHTAGLSPEQVKAKQGQLNQLQEDMRILQGTGASPEQLKAMQDQMAGMARPGPALTTQQGNDFNFPWNPFDMVVYKNPAFRNVVKFQKQAGVDMAMNAWRRLTIARISSAMRMDIGDDMIRPFTQLMFGGHPVAATQYLTGSILKMFGLLTPVARKRIQGGLNGWAAENPQAVKLLQDSHKILQETSTNVFVPLAPGKVGYAQALEQQIRNHWAQDPIAQAWLQAPAGKEREAVASLLGSNEDPRITSWVRAQNAHLSPENMSAAVDRFHGMMGGYMTNPVIRGMATTGKVNARELEKLVRDEANTPHRLPIIPARQNSPFAENTVMRWVNKGPDNVFEHITGPMINTARAGGFMSMKNLFEHTMRDYFKGQPRYGTQAFEQTIDQESTAQAIDWITNNTYQGTRSVAGAALRNIFPFYGATSNMDRFYMRQAMSNPFIGSIVAHATTASSQSQNTQSVNTPGLTGLQGVLAHLGFGAGEGIQFNPMHAFFLTSDGIGSLIPGTGPVFAPVWNAISGHPALAQALADLVPGAQSQIDFNTGQAKPQFPWLADLLQGSIMAATGSEVAIPILGEGQASMDSKVNAKVQQWERAKQGTGANGTVTPADMQTIRQEVGRDMMLQGAASYTAPVDPIVENVQGQQTAQNLDTWRQQTTNAGKDKVILANLKGVTAKQWQAALLQTPNAPSVADLIAKGGPQGDAALMAYNDSRVSQSDRDAIANQSPWVVSAAQSKYQTANLGPNQPDRPFDLPQWQLMRQLGNITNLTPDAFVGAVANERDINTGWLEYDNLKNQEYAAMVQNGWTTSSPQYTAWNAAVFQPQLISIEGNHPVWAGRFGSGGSSTASDLALKTRSLRTLQTWEVLPQHSDFENQQTVLWRNALQIRDNAAGAIYALKAGGGSTAEQQLVMASFQEQLQTLAATDPTFAAQLGGFKFSQWEDIVNLEADEMQANQLAGYPSRVGPQGQG
jgi:hypothetical protein